MLKSTNNTDIPCLGLGAPTETAHQSFPNEEPAVCWGRVRLRLSSQCSSYWRLWTLRRRRPRQTSLWQFNCTGLSNESSLMRGTVHNFSNI